MREHRSSADWLRNGVATWSGAAFVFDSRRPRLLPSRAEQEEEEAEASEPVPAPVRSAGPERTPDRVVVYATPSEGNDWSQGEWQVSGQQSTPRRVSGLDGAGNGWGIEFGTGRRVRMQHWRFVADK